MWRGVDGKWCYCMRLALFLFAGLLVATNYGCERRKHRKDIDDIMDFGVACCIRGMGVRYD